MEDVHCCSPSHSWPLIEALHRQNRWPQLGPRAVLPLAVAVGPVQARCAVRDILMPGSGPRADGAGLIGCIPHFPAAASIPTSVALGQVSSTLPGLACGQHQQDPGWHCRKLGPCQAHTPALGGHFGCVRTAGWQVLLCRWPAVHVGTGLRTLMSPLVGVSPVSDSMPAWLAH